MSGEVHQHRDDAKPMATDYNIHLNFLPFKNELPEFVLYRRIITDPQERRSSEGDIPAYSLPHDPSNTEDREQYWVSFEQRDGFEECRILSEFNHALPWGTLVHSVHELWIGVLYRVE